MRAKQPRVQPNAADPFGNETRILARCYGTVVTTTAGKQEFARRFVGRLQIVIDRLAGLLAQFESDRPPGFLLSDRCAIRRISAGSDILDPDGDDVTAAKLAVDRQIEHGEVASSAFDLELCPGRPDVLGSQWRLRSRQFALVPRRSPVVYRDRIHLILHGDTP